ncbi:chalcone isomerase family protein [Thalassotalea aquiviva]|uniref:chalcone isomerase family protein n=1 Tax=Thalassotalea aquiviva TaxID=3242415 RepID=UPI00352A211A
MFYLSNVIKSLLVSLLLLTVAYANATNSIKSTSPVNSTNQQWQKQQWQKVGEAQLSILFWDIYLAKLFTPNGTFDQIQGPLKLEINYKIDISKQDLVEETENQWQQMAFDHPNSESWLNALSSIFPDIKDGDTLAVELTAENQGILYHNQQQIHQFPASVQLQQFLAIWLSDKSTRPKLMAKLTGQKRK